MRVLLERYFEKLGVEPPGQLMDDARELDMHYIPSRYPNAHPAGAPHEAYSEAVARRALEAAGRIVEYARRALGE